LQNRTIKQKNNLPKGWARTPLGQVAEFKNGVNFSKSQKGAKGILTVDVLNMYSQRIGSQKGTVRYSIENGCLIFWIERCFGISKCRSIGIRKLIRL